MGIKKRMNDLEKVVRGTVMPVEERVQVLRPGESMEKRRAAVIRKYGSAKDVLFIRIKGRD